VVNEVAQWTLILLLGLLVLGLLRQVALVLPPATRTPPPGPQTGRKVPSGLLDVVRGASRNGEFAAGAVVAFVSENCVGCQKLLADAAGGVPDLGGRGFLVATQSASTSFQSALAESGIPSVHIDARLWDECDISATPLLVTIDADGRVVDKEVTHRVKAAVEG
jgi:hypothetical protein